MTIKIFADTANIEEIISLSKNDKISGFTTNPLLLAKGGVKNYVDFAKEVMKHVDGWPVSFEVLSDDISEMKDQALKISEWGSSIYVKIPVMNTKAMHTYNLMNELIVQGIKVNATAITTYDQIQNSVSALKSKTVPSIVSVFAGRIADTGINPEYIIKYAVDYCSMNNVQVLWASSREMYNVYQADELGVDIITLTPDLIKKLELKGKDLELVSQETVKLFYDNALRSGYVL